MATKNCIECGTDDNHGIWQTSMEEQLSGRRGMSASWRFGAKNPLRGYTGNNYYRMVKVYRCDRCCWKASFWRRMREPEPQPNHPKYENQTPPVTRLTAIPIEQIIGQSSMPVPQHPPATVQKEEGVGFWGGTKVLFWTLVCIGLGLKACGVIV